MSSFFMHRTDLNPETFSGDLRYAVSAMNGLCDFSSPAFLPRHRAIAEELCRQGLAFRCCRGFASSTPGPIQGAFWAVTGVCNLKCEHCYMSAPMGLCHSPKLETLLVLMDRLAAGGATELILTGGEVLTLPCLDGLLDHAVKIGMDISNVLSNVTLVTEEKLRLFTDRGLHPFFRVSFDGVGHHSRIRGVEDAEEQTLRGIRLLLRNGFRVSISTTADSDNLSSLPATYEQLKALGIREWGICRPMNFGCARSMQIPDTETFIQACNDIQIRWLRDGRPMTLGLEGLYSYREGGKTSQTPFDINLPSCRECRPFPYLSEEGRLMPCSAYTDSEMAASFPSLAEQDLSECVQSPAFRFALDITYKDILANSPECEGCSQLSKCRMGCRASALINTGAIDLPDPYTCDIMKYHLQDPFYAREAEDDKHRINLRHFER